MNYTMIKKFILKFVSETSVTETIRNIHYNFQNV